MIVEGDILFYRGGDDLASRAVRWWTRGRFAHCEIAVSPTESIGALAGGVVRHAIPQPVTAVAETSVDLDPVRLQNALTWLAKQIAMPYGGLDVVDAALARVLTHGPFLFQRDRYDCSALATNFLLIAGYPLPDNAMTAPAIVTPSGLARMLSVPRT